MKNIKFVFVIFLFFGNTFAQSPQAIPYQAVVRNASGNIISNQPVKLRFSIHDSVATGTIVYKEIHTISTNAQGLVNVNIGKGTIQTGIFSGINWGKNGKFIQIELDAMNNNTYTDLGTTQMMSVPYALYAEKSGNGSSFQHYVGELYGGGVVFHIYKDSLGIEHGLVLSPKNLPNAPFGQNLNNIDILGARNLYDGYSNTIALINAGALSSDAAGECSTATFNGFDDWYLPSILEFQIIFQNILDVEKGLIRIQGSDLMARQLIVDAQSYWTSNDVQTDAAYVYNSYYPLSLMTKTDFYFVRAIRKF